MGGNEPELEDGIENAKILESYGLDILHVSSGVPNPEYKRQVKINNFPDTDKSISLFNKTKISKTPSIKEINLCYSKRFSIYFYYFLRL